MIDSADITTSFWIQSAYRANVSWFTSHVDASVVLIANSELVEQPKWNEDIHAFLNFLEPFEYGLWAMIVFVILVSGVVDWLAEYHRRDRRTVGDKIYEFWAGGLWGGFEAPLSRPSAAYQVFLGLFVLVMVQSCKPHHDSRHSTADTHLMRCACNTRPRPCV